MMMNNMLMNPVRLLGVSLLVASMTVTSGCDEMDDSEWTEESIEAEGVQ